MLDTNEFIVRNEYKIFDKEIKTIAVLKLIDVYIIVGGNDFSIKALNTSKIKEKEKLMLGHTGWINFIIN